MADIFSKEKRSKIMSKIKSKGTKPEIILRKKLFAKGFRYRINYKKLPGKPDIVLPKYKTVIFVHGCFWHGHSDCKDSHLPKSNTDFWETKISENKMRDNRNSEALRQMGYNVLIVWECDLTPTKLNDLLNKIVPSIQNNYKGEHV